MSVQKTLSHFFKPEVRAAGDDLATGKAVFMKPGTDTQVDATIKASTPVKVRFSSTSIASASFFADCSCTSAKRGQMCKHIWATIVVAAEKQPDFFDSKTNLERSAVFAEQADEKLKSPQALARKQANDDFKKAAYEKQKERAKQMRADMKEKRKADKPGKGKMQSQHQTVPSEIEASMKYFETNGFKLAYPLDEDEINNAKRILSRVFHPDKGGSHDEIVELLDHTEHLLRFA